MPDQGVAHNEHAVSAAKLHIAIRRPEVITIQLGVNEAPFQDVLGSDRVELISNQRRLTTLFSGKLQLIQGRPDEKMILVGILESDLRVAVDRQNGHRTQNQSESIWWLHQFIRPRNHTRC